MQVQEIWRYPVKSMAGELLETAELTEAGVAGDRILQVRDSAGRIMTARTRPLLLRHRATLASDHQVLVDGRPWNTADVARDIESAAGPGTRLVESGFLTQISQAGIDPIFMLNPEKRDEAEQLLTANEPSGFVLPGPSSDETKCR